MKYLLFLAALALPWLVIGQDQKSSTEPTLKSILLEQLRSTHSQAGWFVPANTAVAGLTAEQASWTDKKGNHSVGQLAAHLVYWNQRNLARFRGEAVSKFNNNDETFTSFDSARWDATVKQLDEVMTAWEREVEAADEQKLKSWYSTIARIGAHNAYHIGQMIYVRKAQGSWDPEKGVKE
jgi:DinB superfamily